MAVLGDPGKVLPARAGMSRTKNGMITMNASVPRASGDEPKEAEAAAEGEVCSPRERG